MEFLQTPGVIDYGIMAIVFIVAAFVAFRNGPGQIAGFVFAMPTAMLAFQFLPQTVLVGESLAGLLQQTIPALVVFVLVVVGVYTLMRPFVRGGLMDEGQILQSLLAAFSFTTMLFAVWYAAPFASVGWDFNATIDALFAPTYTLGWILLSFGFLYASSR